MCLVHNLEVTQEFGILLGLVSKCASYGVMIDCNVMLFYLIRIYEFGIHVVPRHHCPHLVVFFSQDSWVAVATDKLRRVEQFPRLFQLEDNMGWDMGLHFSSSQDLTKPLEIPKVHSTLQYTYYWQSVLASTEGKKVISKVKRSRGI